MNDSNFIVQKSRDVNLLALDLEELKNCICDFFTNYIEDRVKDI